MEVISGNWILSNLAAELVTNGPNDALAHKDAWRTNVVGRSGGRIVKTNNTNIIVLSLGE